MVPFCCVPSPVPSQALGLPITPPPLGGTNVELATTTYVALETVAREEGCGGHVEPLRGRGRSAYITTSVWQALGTQKDHSPTNRGKRRPREAGTEPGLPFFLGKTSL